jgi:DNA-directed RNA polymerase specialized sigma24 family protein
MVAIPDDVIAARDGDIHAFSRLVRAHAQMVTALATAILGNARAGEEVGQEVFVYAWQGLAGLREP